jgi:hypothetical protein
MRIQQHMKFKDSNGDHPSQRQHNCLMMDEYEWWQMYGLEWFRSGHESIKTGGWQRCTWIFAAKYYLTKRKLTFNGKQIFSNKWCLVFTCSIASKPYICYRWYSFIIRQSCCRWLGWSIWQPLHDSLQTILNFMRYCIAFAYIPSNKVDIWLSNLPVDDVERHSIVQSWGYCDSSA